jgi:cell division GTPase FtsZ
MGAAGILVNVTAGMNLSIGEFEEVGNTIKEFASENATVVVGTVIDPDMKDELRVTVVATGLGRLRPFSLLRQCNGCHAIFAPSVQRFTRKLRCSLHSAAVVLW